MSLPPQQVRQLAERAMRGAGIPLATLLEVLAPVAGMRALAKELGVQPKGGFRVEKASAKVLAEALAEQKKAEHLDRVIALLASRPAAAAANEGRAPKSASKPARAPEPKASPLSLLKEQELKAVRAELQSARAGLDRALERETEMRRDLDHLTGMNRRLRADLGEAHRMLDSTSRVPDPTNKEQHQRVRELEQELAGYVEADSGLRRLLAQARSDKRQLEAEVEELLQLLPKGRRRKQKPPTEPPPPSGRVMLPRFDPAFYRGLEGRDRKSVELAVHAILLLCTEGFSYPGLQAKQLGGKGELWSIRAARGLRIYFRLLDDGSLLFLDFAEREGQNTTIRRLKER